LSVSKPSHTLALKFSFKNNDWKEYPEQQPGMKGAPTVVPEKKTKNMRKRRRVWRTLAGIQKQGLASNWK